MITTRDIKTLFNSDNVDQIASMQLFIVNYNLLVSYKTIIGVIDRNDCWHITSRKYSKPTSKQTTVFKRNNYHVIVDDNIIDSMQAELYPKGLIK